jgi:diaminopimelate epimerase
MRYTLYDASGNTFVIFHTDIEQDYSNLAITLCKKENVDGLIVVVPHEELDFKWLFYNNDGSTASMCGNGTRAVAHYACTNHLAGTNLSFLTDAGVITCTVDENIVETLMTKPDIIKQNFEEEGFNWWLLDTGVPHLITFVNDLELFDLELCATMRHQYNANVNFAKIENGTLYVRTFERGVEGETMACGTGMTAAFLRANMENIIPNKADVYPKSNEKLTLRKDEANQLYFKGSVKQGKTKEQ